MTPFQPRCSLSSSLRFAQQSAELKFHYGNGSGEECWPWHGQRNRCRPSGHSLASFYRGGWIRIAFDPRQLFPKRGATAVGWLAGWLEDAGTAGREVCKKEKEQRSAAAELKQQHLLVRWRGIIKGEGKKWIKSPDEKFRKQPEQKHTLLLKRWSWLLKLRSKLWFFRSGDTEKKEFWTGKKRTCTIYVHMTAKHKISMVNKS